MSLNVSSRLLFQLYMFLDFLFLASYPVEQIYWRSKSAVNTSNYYTATYIMQEASQYTNPADRLYNLLSYDDAKKVMLIFIIYIFLTLAVLLAQIFSRNKKKLHITSQTKFYNQVLGLVIIVNSFLLFIPLVSFLAKLFYCDQRESSCFQGEHLALTCFSVLSIFILTALSMFTLSMMTSCYPNETVPWAHFPSKIHHTKVLFTLFVILTYQIDQQREIVLYLNPVFVVLLAAFLYRRVRMGMTFDRAIHLMNYVFESLLIVLFLVAFVSDLISTNLNTLFTLCLVCSFLGVSALIINVSHRTREAFLKKIDIFNYRYEFDALHMMMALHELIEMSNIDEREDFILRGFVERHIEICDFPECNCMEYYKVINSAYRIQLATIATMKEDENNKGSISTVNNRTTYDDETTQDDNSMQKTFFVQTKNLVKQNKVRTKFLNNFLINNIKVFLELFPSSVKLRYMSAFIYFNMFKNSFKALYELSYTQTLKSSFGDTYDSYTLGLKIIQYFTSRVNSFLSKESKILDLEIDLKQIIEFEKLNIKYQKSIEQTSEIAEAFWLELNKKNINIDNIFRLGSDINSQFYMIKKKYKKLMSINSNYLEVAYLYKLFVSLCLNYELEETEAKMEITKILQAKGMRKKNLRQEYSRINFSDENGMIIISGCQKDFSKILAMNNKAERIFGYNTDELINHSLTKLQPLVYGYSHEDFILNYVNSKRKINKDNHNFVWGKHKSGFIMPLVMDISPYVTFEYNLCFIAFCKRSILLEMYPLKEILDAQDVFVLLADQKGVITDMTRNITEWLGFPLQALNKDISLEQIFDGILEDELEKEFLDGKKIDFFMNSFKDALDDFENRSEDEFESTLCMKEKKCRALVWMKMHEYQLAPHGYIQPAAPGLVTGSGIIGTMGGSVMAQNYSNNNQLVVREIWFVLLEEDAATATATASFLDTKNTHESGMEKEELKFTYQEDREEICSLASVSSLAGYGTSDKGLINKLSEIKTSTVEESKPRSISLLQKALVIVFILSVLSAIIILVFALIKDQNFFKALNEINNTKLSTINYQNMQIIIRELVNIANGSEDNKSSFINSTTLSAFLETILLSEAESFRLLQQDLDQYDNSFMKIQYENYKLDSVTLSYLRQDGYYYSSSKSFALAFYELLTQVQEVGQVANVTQLALNRTFLNQYMAQGFSPAVQKLFRTNPLSEMQRQIYWLLENQNSDDMNFYAFKLSQNYIETTYSSITQNQTLFLAITVLAIAITFMTAVLIIPIILRIESNKEKVFFIYAELSKNDVDDRKRNIRIFFAKLRQSTNNPGGSLFYQKSSRIVSSRLLTKKFSMKDESNQLGTLGLSRQGAMGGGLINKEAEKNQGDMEEDMRAELMKQQEELEAAVFKKIFHKKIKQMSLIKKIKYIMLVLFFAGLVQGYFLLNYFLIANIDNNIEESLGYYQIISSRDPLFNNLIAYYRESQARNTSMMMVVDDIEGNGNMTLVPFIDYFLDQTQQNEKNFNSLRQNVPSMMADTNNFINNIEGNQFCSSVINQYPQSICETALDGILKTGVTQTIASMIKAIIQSQINFQKNRFTESSLSNLINDNQIRSIIYLKLMYLDDAFETLITTTTDSIQSYFKTMERNLIIIFVIFVLLMFVGVGISTTWGMNFLYRHFNATKSILNLIPGKCLLELSEKTDLKKIQF